MKQIKALLIVTILLSIAYTANAEEKKKELGVTLDLTYMSKWMTKGSEGYGSDPALFKRIYVDFWDTGFGVSVWHQEATNSGWVNKERFSYVLYYRNSLFDDSAYRTKYKIRWRYKHHLDQPRNARNTQEWQLKFSWSKILPVENLAPYYTAFYEYPAGSHYNNRTITGWTHIFGMGYDLRVPELPNPIRLAADVAYRDGFGGSAVDHDWAYATACISTKFKIIKNLSFVPTLCHQISMDDSVCKRDDVTYCKLSMMYKF